jgi:hypothetical protein
MQQRLQHQADVRRAMKKLKSKYGDLKEINHFKYTVLDNEFQIHEKLGEGTFGQIYTGASLKHKIGGVPTPVIIKFSQAHDMNDQEYDAMKDI